QEDAHQQQVAVDLGVQGQEAIGPFEHVDNVFEQSADIGMVVANARRGAAEVAQERLVHEEALGQGAQVRVAGLHQGGAECLLKFSNVLVGMRQEVGQIDALGANALQVVEDDLQRPLEQLHLAADLDEVAFVQRAE